MRTGNTKRLTCIESLKQFHERCRTSHTSSSSANDNPEVPLPQMCDCCHYYHIMEHSSDIKNNVAPPILTAVEAPGIRAEMLMIFEILMRTVREVVKADAEKCTAQHADKNSTLTLKKCSTDSRMKNVLKTINKKSVCRCYHVALTATDVEYFLTALLHCGVLALYYHFTPYASLCYLQPGYHFDLSASHKYVQNSLEEAFMQDIMQRVGSGHEKNEIGVSEQHQQLVQSLKCYYLFPKECFGLLRSSARIATQAKRSASGDMQAESVSTARNCNDSRKRCKDLISKDDFILSKSRKKKSCTAKEGVIRREDGDIVTENEEVIDLT